MVRPRQTSPAVVWRLGDRSLRDHFICLECGPHVKADEDWCCVTCGADCEVVPCECETESLLRKDLRWQLTFEEIDWDYFIETAQRARCLAQKENSDTPDPMEDTA